MARFVELQYFQQQLGELAARWHAMSFLEEQFEVEFRFNDGRKVATMCATTQDLLCISKFPVEFS